MRSKDLVLNSINELQSEFKKIDELTLLNSEKVLNAFHKYNINQNDFIGTTGYGYGDIGRDKIEKVFASVLDAEDALVRNQFISGTHALTVAFFGLLRPNDILLSISGQPYDTLHEVIGIIDNDSSLKSFGIIYDQIDLINDDFDYLKIEKYLNDNKVKVIEIQKSIGYSTRKTINNESLEKVIKLIKKVSKDTIIMVDNCYCELVSDSPLKIGADIIVGSLIKNLGGGVAKNGGYVAGRKDLVDIIAQRLTVPGCGKEVGPSLDANYEFIKGLYMAPSVVGSSLKINVLTAYILENLGYKVVPRYNEIKNDIVLSIYFNNANKLINFTKGIQNGSAIDSHATVMPSDMPGYDDKIIMASGSFVQGSSIEISCDGPIRSPYIAYMQGSLTFEYGVLALITALEKILED